MTTSRALELRENAGRLVTEARSIFEAAEKENRNLNSEEQVRFDKLHEEAEKTLATADRYEKQARADLGFETPREEEKISWTEEDLGEKAVGKPAGKHREDRCGAMAQFLRGGYETLNTEQRATLQMDNDIGGGWFAATETFINRLLFNADKKMVLSGLCTTYNVGLGETLGVPTLDGDITDFTMAGELTSAAEDTGITFGKRELRPHRIKRKLVKFSKDLLQNSRIDVEQVVVDRVSLALARALDGWFMTGTGASQPLGIFTASDDGISTSRDVDTGSATGITADGLITVQATLNDVYEGNARWLFHKDAITLIRKLKDGNQQYLWQPGLSAGAPSVILGKPYVTATNVPSTYTDGNYAGMYGDFSYYWIANAATLSIQRLIEMYANEGQIGLLFDGLGVDAMPVLQEAFVRIKCAA